MLVVLNHSWLRVSLVRLWLPKADNKQGVNQPLPIVEFQRNTVCGFEPFSDVERMLFKSPPIPLFCQKISTLLTELTLANIRYTTKINSILGNAIFSSSLHQDAERKLPQKPCVENSNLRVRNSGLPVFVRSYPAWAFRIWRLEAVSRWFRSDLIYCTMESLFPLSIIPPPSKLLLTHFTVNCHDDNYSLRPSRHRDRNGAIQLLGSPWPRHLSRHPVAHFFRHICIKFEQF